MMCMMFFGYSASFRVSAGINITQSYRYGSFWRFNTLYPLLMNRQLGYGIGNNVRICSTARIIGSGKLTDDYKWINHGKH